MEQRRVEIALWYMYGYINEYEFLKMMRELE